MARAFTAFFNCLLVLILVSCGSETKRAFAPVKGKVVFNGQPVTAGVVRFVAEESAVVYGIGRLTEAGDFQGHAPVGKVKVVVLTAGFKPADPAKKSVKPKPPADLDAKSAPPGTKFGTKYVATPAKYEKADTSDLGLTIKTGDNDLGTITLTN